MLWTSSNIPHLCLPDTAACSPTLPQQLKISSGSAMCPLEWKEKNQSYWGPLLETVNPQQVIRLPFVSASSLVIRWSHIWPDVSKCFRNKNRNETSENTDPVLDLKKPLKKWKTNRNTVFYLLPFCLTLISLNWEDRQRNIMFYQKEQHPEKCLNARWCRNVQAHVVSFSRVWHIHEARSLSSTLNHIF